MPGDRCAPLARERVAPFEPSGSLSACRKEVPVSRCCVPLSWRPSSKGGMAIAEFCEPLRPTPNSCHMMRQGMRREPMGFLTWIRVSALFGSRARSPSAGTVSVLLGPTVQGRQSTSSRAGPLRWIRCMCIFLSRSGLSGNGQQACRQWLAPASHVLAPRPLRRPRLASGDVVAQVMTDLARCLCRGIVLVCVGVVHGMGRPSARLRAGCFLVVVLRSPDLNSENLRDQWCLLVLAWRERCRGDGCTQLIQVDHDVTKVDERQVVQKSDVEGGPPHVRKEEDEGASREVPRRVRVQREVPMR